MEKILITRMKTLHIDQVVEVEDSCFAIPWSKESFEQEIIDNSVARYFVALNNDKVVGYGGFWKVVDEAHITNIAVHPDHRKKGIASNLLNEMIKLAYKEEICLLTLEVREGNIKAQALYEKFGFQIAGKRKNYYADNKEDAIIMTLNFQ